MARKARSKMCSDCPFGISKEQLHMRGFQVTDKDGPEGIAKGQREAEERRVRAENILRKKLLEIIPDVSVPSMKHTIAERILVAVQDLKRQP